MGKLTVKQMAKQYYPRLWDKPRIEALVQAGRLTEEEAAEILANGDGLPEMVPDAHRTAET